MSGREFELNINYGASDLGFSSDPETHEINQQDKSLPASWPKGIKLPTREEAEAAVRAAEKRIAELAEERKGKLLEWDKDMFTIIIGFK